METITMFDRYKLDDETIVFNSYVPLPALGVIPVNSFLLKSEQPVLVDTNMGLVSDKFFEELNAEINPKDIKWIWITHGHADHVGNLFKMLELAPDAKVATTYMGMGLLSILGVPPERMHLIIPGESLDVGDRKLEAVVPPTIDSPETCGFVDHKSKKFFGSDAFGTIMNEPIKFADDLDPRLLREGMFTWLNLENPWLHFYDEDKFEEHLEFFDGFDASMILTSHLPPALDIQDELMSLVRQSVRQPVRPAPGMEIFQQPAA